MNPSPSLMEDAAATMMAAIDAGKGSFVNLFTRCGARYQGYVSRVDSPEFIIALTDVRCFGTEGRRMDGHDFSGSEKIYEYIIFQGSEVIELQFLSLPPAQIGFVQSNYMPAAGYIAQSSTLPVPHPMQYPSMLPATFSGLQQPSLLPVGPTTHFSPEQPAASIPQPVSLPIRPELGQNMQPLISAALPSQSLPTAKNDVKAAEASCSAPAPRPSLAAIYAKEQLTHSTAKTASIPQPVSLPIRPELGQNMQPWISAALPSQSLPTAKNDVKAAEASCSAPAARPSLAAIDAKEQLTHSTAKTALGLPPRPPSRRGQGEKRAVISQGLSARGRGSAMFGRGRGRQVWSRVQEK